MKRLLVLRPQPGAQATLARARQMGFEAFAIPLFEFERIEWRAPDPSDFDGLLLTSARSALPSDELAKLGHLPVYAVGEATAAAARKAGLLVVATGVAGVDELLRSIDPDTRLLHLSGEDRREPQSAAQPITAISVYRAKPIEHPDAGSLSEAVALVHSPRAGQRLGELVKDRSTIAIAAISTAAAEAAGSGWEVVEAALEPTDDALLVLAARLCNKPQLA
jgi:uroporphyrinogen-III synthase